MTLLFIHVKHVLEIRRTELLLALIRRSRITLIASNCQTCRVGNHYPPLHNRVLGEERKKINDNYNTRHMARTAVERVGGYL